jgi:hypothetical protein
MRAKGEMSLGNEKGRDQQPFGIGYKISKIPNLYQLAAKVSTGF